MAQCTKTELELLVVPCSHDWDSCPASLTASLTIVSPQSWTGRQHPEDRNGDHSHFIRWTSAPSSWKIADRVHPDRSRVAGMMVSAQNGWIHLHKHRKQSPNGVTPPPLLQSVASSTCHDHIMPHVDDCSRAGPNALVHGWKQHERTSGTVTDKADGKAANDDDAEK